MIAWLQRLFGLSIRGIRVMSMDELAEVWGAGGDAPAPDPAIGVAAQQQAAVAGEQLQLGEDQLNYTKQQDAQWAPFYEKMANQQFDTSQEAADRATASWDQYTSVFQPIEDQVASDSQSWDSAGGVATAQANAAGTTNQAFDQSSAITSRNLARQGVSASSGRNIETANETGNARALAVGSAETDAATTRQMQGIALRQQAANLGRGISSGADATAALATTADSGASGSLAAQNAARNSGIASVSGLYANASQGYGQEAGTYNGLFGTQMAGYNAGQARTGAYVGAGATVAAAGIGSYLSSAAGAAALAAL